MPSVYFNCQQNGPRFCIVFLIIIVMLAVPSFSLALSNKEVKWSYSGGSGPLFWGSLSTDFVLCYSGKRQSPINVGLGRSVDLYPLQFNYSPVTLQVLNNKHTLQANYRDLSNQKMVTIAGEQFPLKTVASYNSYLRFGDIRYDLIQFHFHSPSEHTQAGTVYPMEVHLVHSSANGDVAVVGVFISEGGTNKVLQSLLDHAYDIQAGSSVVMTKTINAADLLPGADDLFYYSGSLTTPPCSENVSWFVMQQTIEVSKEQIQQFIRLVGNNARPLQPLNWRVLYQSR